MKKTISIISVLALFMVAGVAKADFVFGEPTNLGPMINTAAFDSVPDISTDGLSLYFSSNRSGGYGSYDLWVTTRATTADDWGRPVNLGPTVNSSSWDMDPSISSDGLSLYFMSTRPGGSGGRDTWVTTRATKDSEWTTPVNLGPTVNSSYDDCCADISADGLSLFFWSGRPGGSGGQDLWVTTRTSVSDPWDIPVNLGPTVNSSAWDGGPSISSDGLGLIFFSERSGGSGGKDLWLTRRTSVSAPWDTPVNLGPTVNSAYDEYPPDIFCDGSILYFSSYRTGGFGDADLWQVSIDPIVDLNADGIVDAADMCIAVDHWGQSCSLCDIGPTPLGDGVVDVEDLKILAEHLFEQVDDPTLVAHWALDETEGMLVVDSAGGSDGYAIGNPVWLPDGGMVNGALEFDGADDYVETDRVLSPADGAFSVVAWIQGGAPGQVFVSQGQGSNWLMLDSEGRLMTELKRPGRGIGTGLLLSQTAIDDGNWHRIGFMWDGSYRHLYADGVEVAADVEPLTALEGSTGGPYLGAGSHLAPGTFFSGLIDDVRIYSRAINP